MPPGRISAPSSCARNAPAYTWRTPSPACPAGSGSESYTQITKALAEAQAITPPRFWSWLEKPYAGTTKLVARAFRGSSVGTAASRLEVFMPYLTFNTVFDNSRIVAELGRAPDPFSKYCPALMRWSLEHQFRYPYQEYAP